MKSWHVSQYVEGSGNYCVTHLLKRKEQCHYMCWHAPQTQAQENIRITHGHKLRIYSDKVPFKWQRQQSQISLQTCKTFTLGWNLTSRSSHYTVNHGILYIVPQKQGKKKTMVWIYTAPQCGIPQCGQVYSTANARLSLPPSCYQSNNTV